MKASLTTTAWGYTQKQEKRGPWSLLGLSCLCSKENKQWQKGCGIT